MISMVHGARDAVPRCGKLQLRVAWIWLNPIRQAPLRAIPSNRHALASSAPGGACAAAHAGSRIRTEKKPGRSRHGDEGASKTPPSKATRPASSSAPLTCTPIACGLRDVGHGAARADVPSRDDDDRGSGDTDGDDVPPAGDRPGTADRGRSRASTTTIRAASSSSRAATSIC